MAELALFPVLGINNVAREDVLSRGENGRFVRDAFNVDIHADGRVSLRRGFARRFALPLRDVWQSPLHGDVFAVCRRSLVRVDKVSGSLQVLLDGVERAGFVLLNNKVGICCDRGWFVYDGSDCVPLGIDTPPAPVLAEKSGGSLPAGTYGVAVSWLRGGLESGLGAGAFIAVGESGGFSVALPVCWDSSVTGARVYMTDCNGGVFRKVGDFAVDAVFDVFRLPELGRNAENAGMQAMPSGVFACLWRGRLVTAQKNVLRFSRPLAFHWHDVRDYIQLPQRISFVVAVEGGLWVGQQTGVVFLAGGDADGFQLVQTGASRPVYGSACLLPADLAGEAGSGMPCALWLAQNGFVLGTASGQIVEKHAGILDIGAERGRAVVFGREAVVLTE